MMKKEKLEQMKELGRGGLSKGLTMLRNAAEKAAAAAESANAANAQHASNATAYAAITALEDDSDASAAAAATGSAGSTANVAGNAAGAAGGVGAGNRLTYDELVTLSMKLTRQNKMMKAQFQKMQARITSLSVKEADAKVLTGFVKDVVGVDLDACHLDESKASDGGENGNANGGDVAGALAATAIPTIDAEELKERYVILQELNEREHRRVEERLRAELSSLRSGQSNVTPAPASNGTESVSLLSFSPVGAPPAPGMQSYDEIDLFSEPFPTPPTAASPAPVFADFSAVSSSGDSESITNLGKQLADARAQLERLQEQLSASFQEREELQKKFSDVHQQQADQVTAIETEKQELQSAVEEMKRAVEVHETSEQEWQIRWNEQNQVLVNIRAELQQKIAAESGLAAENETIKSKLEELSILLAESKATSADGADSTSLESEATHAPVDSMRDENEALSRKIDELTSELTVKSEEIEKLRAEVSFLQVENQALDERIKISASNAVVDGEIGVMKDTIASLQSALSDKEEKLNELENALAAARTENGKPHDTTANGASSEDGTSGDSEQHSALNAEIASLKENLDTLKQDNESLQLKLAELGKSTDPAPAGQDDLAPLLGELEKVKMERAEMDHTLRTLQEKLRVAESQRKVAQEEIERSNSLVDALKENTSRLADELAGHKREKEGSDRKYASLQGEVDILQTAKEALEEELGVLRRDTHANLESTLAEVEETKKQVSSAELEKAQLESRMAEEREYLKSKIETVIKELDIMNKQNENLQSVIDEKEKQVKKMASSQASITSEMMELQTQIASMREDLHMAAEGLEAHAMRAEQSDLKRQEIEGKMTNMKMQMDSMRDQHRTDFEMLRQEKEAELERVKQDRSAIAQKLSDLESARSELQVRFSSLEVAYSEEQKRAAELEATISQQTTSIGNLSVDLAETKKALSDRMGLATRLQTENMGIAAKQAEQAALIENALREAAASKEKAHEMEMKMQDAKTEMERAKKMKENTVSEMKKMMHEMEHQRLEIESEKERSAIQFKAAVDAEKEAFKREVERIEAESKHKSKLAIQAVLEKEAEIKRLSSRLAELEEDVRSGDADHRKIFEVAQLQAKREAESRAQALQLQEMANRLDEAYRHIQRLQEEKQQHDQELTALMQTQRREGVNMEYLKNVVVQYMSFRPGSSQQSRLVPVLSTLLQFSARDMKEIKSASNSRRSSWTSWGTETKDYKPILDGKGQRHSMIPPSPASSSALGSFEVPPRASSFTLPHAMESASSDPSAFASHSTSESADF